MNVFDSIQETAFNVVANTFGYSATWLPAGGGPEKSATVLYKDATEKHGLGDVDFEVERYVMEFKHTDFAGLRESIAQGNNEKVKIATTPGVFLEFYVRRTERKFDGKTVAAYLTPVD